jgi:cobalamin biosynthesis protein CobT
MIEDATIISEETVEVDFTDFFGRSKANNYSFESQKMVRWGSGNQEIIADYFLEGDRRTDQVVSFFSKIANSVKGHKNGLSGKSQLALPVDLLDKNLGLVPNSIDHFVGKATLEMEIYNMMNVSQYESYRRDLFNAAGTSSNPRTLLKNLITEESALKKLADKYPGYAKYFETYRKEVQANSFAAPKNESEEVLTLLSKLIRYPGAISQAELDKHKEFVKALENYYSHKRIPQTEPSIERMSNEVYDIMLKYLIDPPKEDKKEDEGDGEGDGKSGDPKKGEGGSSDGKKATDGKLMPAPVSKAGMPSNEGKGDKSGSQAAPGYGTDSPAEADIVTGDHADTNPDYDLSDSLSDSGKKLDKTTYEKPVRTKEEIEKELSQKAAEISRKATIEHVEEKLSKRQKDLNESIKNNIKEAKEKAKDESPTTSAFVESHFNYASKSQLLKDPATSEKTEKRYLRLKAAAPMNKANVLKNKLLVKIQNYDFTVKGMKSGRLDGNKLVEAYQSVETVYEKIGHVDTSKVSVGILIDESGSMSLGTRMGSAVQTAIMIEHALGKQSNVNLFIYGHYSSGHSCVVTRYIEPGWGKPSNLGTSLPRGANYDGDAIAVCAKRMRKITNDPILFFVISDGAPSAPSYSGSQAVKHVKNSVNLIEKKANMQIVQVAIASSVPSEEMFNHHVKFTNLETLPGIMAKYVAKHLDEKMKVRVTL